MQTREAEPEIERQQREETELLPTAYYRTPASASLRLMRQTGLSRIWLPPHRGAE